MHGQLPHVYGKDRYYHTAATMSVKDDQRTFAGPRRRLILANPKYCSCNQPKKAKYNGKKYERFGQGQGGIDQRRGGMN